MSWPVRRRADEILVWQFRRTLPVVSLITRGKISWSSIYPLFLPLPGLDLRSLDRPHLSNHCNQLNVHKSQFVFGKGWGWRKSMRIFRSQMWAAYSYWIKPQTGHYHENAIQKRRLAQGRKVITYLCKSNLQAQIYMRFYHYVLPSHRNSYAKPTPVWSRASLRQPRYRPFPYSTKSQLLYMFRKVRRESLFVMPHFLPSPWRELEWPRI